MNSLQSLSDALCDLLRQLEGSDINLIVGGGFGIYLKAEHVRSLGADTHRAALLARSTLDE